MPPCHFGRHAGPSFASSALRVTVSALLCSFAHSLGPFARTSLCVVRCCRRYFAGGNDFEIYEHPRTIGHAITEADPLQTLKILESLFPHLPAPVRACARAAVLAWAHARVHTLGGCR
jgi:hypothetical protein